MFANLFIHDTPGSGIFAVYFFLNSCLMGSGHIYTTGWRTYLNPAELRRSMIYLWAPLLCFSAFFCWRYFSLHWLIYVPAYAAIWHHIRQSFGIQKWYQRQNGVFRKGSDYFTYFLCAVPFLIFHFRDDAQFNSILFKNDLFSYPNNVLKYFFYTIYLIGFLGWVIYEVKLLKHKEWNRLGHVALVAFLNAWCFCVGQGELGVLFPLVAYHGVAYFAIMSSTLTKTKVNFTVLHAVTIVLLTGLVFGYYERVIEFKEGLSPSLFWESIWAGIYVTPILSHYIFDAFLWQAKHPEAHLVYGSKPTLRSAESV